MSEWEGGEHEREVEVILQDVASKNKDVLDSAKIVPLSSEWKFCTNGMYLLMATAGCGKSGFIMKHILMCDRIAKGRYYSLIAYCSKRRTPSKRDIVVSSRRTSHNGLSARSLSHHRRQR
jgi:hypothetical protein